MLNYQRVYKITTNVVGCGWMWSVYEQFGGPKMLVEATIGNCLRFMLDISIVK